MNKYAYIHTYGCQMNEHDSRRMEVLLTKNGYHMVGDYTTADIVLINTCSVRENPENKVFSMLGRLKKIKRKNPELIVGVCGCVAQQEGKKILKREKVVDLVFGPDKIFSLMEMLNEVQRGKRIVKTDWMERDKSTQNFIPDFELKSNPVKNHKALITITKGCDNYCSYCIVPTTRGRLVSREKENILVEARNLIENGAKEIQLLGQNVNSYHTQNTGFYELLKAIADLEGLKRLRFTSPHPNDWNSELTDLMVSHPVICNQIHLPFQAGSNRILSLMRRGHTAEEYLEKMAYLIRQIPGIGLGTDIIVGFPGETEDEFQDTLNIVKEVRFNNIYAFKYSSRPGTKAANMADSVPLEEKEDRLQRLFKLQDEIQSELLEDLVGTVQEILIDSVHPKELNTMNSRTGGNIPVTIPDTILQIGDLLKVEIVGKKRHSLIGQEQSKKS